MKRSFALALIMSSAALAYACSSSKDEPTPTPTPDDGGTTQQEGGSTDGGDGGTTEDGSTQQDGGEDLTKNPIEGVAAPTVLKDVFQFVDGPQVLGDFLYVSLPFATDTCGGPGILLKMKADGTNDPEQARCGDGATSGTLGNSVDKSGQLISAERTKVTRTPNDGGAPITIASQYTDKDGGTQPFDTPNDLVARDDGTIYVTDPGYLATITDALNHLVRIAPNGQATLIADYADVPRPNGIALSPDQKTLYVSFTTPPGAAKPYISKMTLKADGTVDATVQKWVELPVGSSPDGLAMDKGGNVYVAWASGVNVYKADGTRWGAEPSIAVPGAPASKVTGLAFGGADKKTLIITTESGKIYRTTTKLTGISQ